MMPRPRFTVRQAKLAVLLVAVVLGAFEAGRRWEREHAVSVSQRIALRRVRAEWLAASRAYRAAALSADTAHSAVPSASTTAQAPPPAGNPR